MSASSLCPLLYFIQHSEGFPWSQHFELALLIHVSPEGHVSWCRLLLWFVLSVCPTRRSSLQGQGLSWLLCYAFLLPESSLDIIRVQELLKRKKGITAWLSSDDIYWAGLFLFLGSPTFNSFLPSISHTYLSIDWNILTQVVSYIQHISGWTVWCLTKGRGHWNHFHIKGWWQVSLTLTVTRLQQWAWFQGCEKVHISQKLSFQHFVETWIFTIRYIYLVYILFFSLTCSYPEMPGIWSPMWPQCSNSNGVKPQSMYLILTWLSDLTKLNSNWWYSQQVSYRRVGKTIWSYTPRFVNAVPVTDPVFSMQKNFDCY